MKSEEITVDKGTCIGCGTCVMTYPNMFKLEGGKAEVVPGAEVDDLKAEVKAVCPNRAIINAKSDE